MVTSDPPARNAGSEDYKFHEQQKIIKNGLYETKTQIMSQSISQGDDEFMEISGYKPNLGRSILTWIGYIFTLGILRLIFHWYPHLGLKATFEKCSLNNATKLLIVDNFQGKYKSYFVKEIKYMSTCDISINKTTSCTDKVNIVCDNITIKENNLTFQLENGIRKEAQNVRLFHVKKLCYIWDEKQNKFLRLIGLDKGMTNDDFHKFIGYSDQEQSLRRIIYGANEINVPVQSLLTLLVLEALNPIYIFQVFTLVVWIAEFYYYYTIAIIVMSVCGIASSVIQTRKNQKNLRGTVHSMEKVKVCRGENLTEDIPSTDLVPGDVLLIPTHGCTMPCDAVLLEGTCIVNESMLTGESVPVTKTALPNTNVSYNIKEDNNHTLHCGTNVIQTRFYGSNNVRAVVIRTGYLTTKGQLIRSILYPPPADFKFDRDSYRFMGILAFIAFLGFLYTIISKTTRGLSAVQIILKALDIITIVVPPVLPAAMTVGKLYAIGRLKKNKIFCMNSRVINVTGSINCVCFDKTGTLTEDGLDMWGVIPVSNGFLDEPVKDVRVLAEDCLLLMGMVSCHSLTIIDNQLSGDPLDVKMFESTGWILEEPEVPDSSKYDLLVPTIVKPGNKFSNSRKCSTLSDTANNKYSGSRKCSALSDIYKFSNSRKCSTTLSEISTKSQKENKLEIGIIKQHQFSSTLQRMSVVTRKLDTDYFEVFCKGSPEMIMSLSKPETVPNNLLEKLKTYTEQGYRVIALGNRIINESFLKISKMNRNEIEKDLCFQGLIILENQLKPETAGVIATLKKADIKVVMITGDNIQTALSVARECGIVDQGDKILDVHVIPADKTGGARVEFHQTGIPNTIKSSENFDLTYESIENKLNEVKYHIAMTGKSWSLAKEYFPDLIPKLVTKGTVFARMSGEQKQQLVLELQSLGYYVAMCGDGANDCGALKAAHTGISLSEAESSVASPFTSTEPNISCVPKVIREGRAALVTSFGVFKFIVAYSLTEFLSVIILYGIDSNLTNLQFLFIDVCLVVNFSSVFGKTNAYEKQLVKKPPMTSLLSFIPLLSLICFMIMATFFQYLAYYVVQTFDWFTPYVYNPNEPLLFYSYENYTVFCISLFQYIIMAIVFSKGRPYREPFYTNLTFFTSILIMTVICVYITIHPAEWIKDALELLLPPNYEMNFLILCMAFVNFILCLFVESFIIEYLLQEKIKPYFWNVEKTNKKYLKIEQEINETNWFNASKYQNGYIKNDCIIYENEVGKNGYINGNFENTENITTKL